MGGTNEEHTDNQKIVIDKNDRFAIFGDIGGTNFRLRIVREQRKHQEAGSAFDNNQPLLSYETILQKKYQTRDYQSFAVFLDRLLGDANVPKDQVVRVMLATCRYSSGLFIQDFANESVDKLREHFNGNAEITIMNDVEGQGLSLIYQEELLKIQKDYLIQLKHPKTIEVPNHNSQVKFLFTMGTGNGSSLILPYYVTQPDGTVTYRHFVRPSESWASSISPDETNPRQQALGKYLFGKMKTKSSILKFCKGPGILSLYQFMQKQHPDLKTNIDKVVKKALKKQAKQDIKLSGIKEKSNVTQQECITYAAVNGLDDLCAMTIDFLVEIIAQCLSKLALTLLPMGGIYIGGGVGNFLAEYIEKKQDIFWKHFLNHPIMGSLLEQFPVYVMKENPTIDGMQVMQLNEENKRKQSNK